MLSSESNNHSVIFGRVNCSWSSPAQSFLGPGPARLIAMFFSGSRATPCCHSLSYSENSAPFTTSESSSPCSQQSAADLYSEPSLPSCFFKIHFKIILSYTSRSYKWSHPQKWPPKGSTRSPASWALGDAESRYNHDTCISCERNVTITIHVMYPRPCRASCGWCHFLNVETRV
jgi:hypothetical protein